MVECCYTLNHPKLYLKSMELKLPQDRYPDYLIKADPITKDCLTDIIFRKFFINTNMQDLNQIETIIISITFPKESISLPDGKLIARLIRNGVTTRSYMWISDRIVNAGMRGRGIGKMLLNIIEDIATHNGCVAIGCEIKAEESINQKIVEQEHKKRGYEIDSKSIAIKNLK